MLVLPLIFEKNKICNDGSFKSKIEIIGVTLKEIQANSAF